MNMLNSIRLKCSLVAAIILMFFGNGCAADSTVRFITASDMHFDPYQACAAKTRPCPLIEKLRVASAEQWHTILANSSKQKRKLGSDANFSVLQASLSALARAATANQVQFAILFGDSLGHDYITNYFEYASDQTMPGYYAFVYKTFQFLNIELAQALPKISIYSIIGNNDSYTGHYDLSKLQNFATDIGGIWSELLQNKADQSDFKNQFSSAGYFALTILEANNLLLIGLNTTIFSNYARGGDIDYLANKQLTFLHDSLALAKMKKQQVMIIMHIPDMVDVYASLQNNPYKTEAFWKPEFSVRFQTELNDYPSGIIAILAGHQHVDWLQERGTIPVIGIPATSTVLALPEFKVFTYSTLTNQLSNYQTYIQNKSSNKTTRQAYDFNTAYQPNCNNCQLLDGLKKINFSGKQADAYRTYYYFSQDKKIPANQWKFHWCSIHYASIEDYDSCLISF